MATSPITETRKRVKTAMEAEFPGTEVLHDKLDDSVGEDGLYMAVYPEDQEPMFGDAAVMESRVVAQYFAQYDKVVDRYQTVDPTPIEEAAERLQRRLQASYVGTKHDWFISVRRVEFPDDPTGNKTRFLMYITGHAQNPQIVETTG